MWAQIDPEKMIYLPEKRQKIDLLKINEHEEVKKPLVHIGAKSKSMLHLKLQLINHLMFNCTSKMTTTPLTCGQLDKFSYRHSIDKGVCRL